MDFKTFFMELKENGRTGGLFVVVFLIFIFLVFLWKLAIGILAPLLAVQILISSGRRLSEFNFKVVSAILFFLLTTLIVLSLAVLVRTILEIDSFRLVLPIAVIMAISYSLNVLKSYLSLSRTHQFIYFALPVLFLSSVWIQFYLFNAE